MAEALTISAATSAEETIATPEGCIAVHSLLLLESSCKSSPLPMAHGRESVSDALTAEIRKDSEPQAAPSSRVPETANAPETRCGFGPMRESSLQSGVATLASPRFVSEAAWRRESITPKMLKDNFHLPLHTVAKKFGMCTTAFKKLCRRFSVPKWPHRQVELLPALSAGTHLRVLTQLCGAWQLRGVDKKIAAIRAELAYAPGADKSHLEADLAELCEEKARLLRGVLGARQESVSGSASSEEEVDATPPPSAANGAPDEKGASDEDSGSGEDDGPAHQRSDAGAPAFFGRSELVTEQELRDHFHLPLHTVAKKFGMCTTAFKKMCRRFSIAKWPHRQLRGIDKKIAALRAELNYSTGDKDTCRQSLAALEEEKARLSSVALGHEAGSPTHAPASPSGGASEGACRTARKFSDDHSEPPSFGARARALSGLDVLAQVAGIDAPLEPLERESTCLSTASTAIEAAPPSPVAASESAPPAAARSAHKAFSLRGADGARTEDESPAERAQPLSPLLHGIKLEGFAQLRAFPPPAGLAVLSQLPLLRLSTAAAMPPASAGLPGGLIPRFNAAQ